MIIKKKIYFLILLLIIISIGIVLVFAPSNAKYRDAQELIDAIEAGDKEQIIYLLENGVDPNQTDIPVSQYWSILEIGVRRPLAVACSTGDYEIVSVLVEHGATAEYIQDTGWSPLKRTLFHYDADDVKIVELLLANGADPDKEEVGEHLVFTAAQMYPMPRGSADYLTGYDEEAAENITKIVEMLLANQTINLQSPAGETILMYAAMRNNMALAKYCIIKGCDVTLTNVQGKTAYDIAVEHGNTDIATLITNTMRP